MPSKYPYPISPPLCPHCSIPMEKRSGRYGFFWGCPNYPRCPFTLDYPYGKLSSSQRGFLECLLNAETLCKTTFETLHTLNDTESIYQEISKFETEYDKCQKSLEPYYKLQKYVNTRISLNALVGTVYYYAAKALARSGEYTEALRINGVAKGLTQSSHKERNIEVIKLQEKLIRQQMELASQPVTPLPAAPAEPVPEVYLPPPPPDNRPQNGYLNTAATVPSKSSSRPYLKYFSFFIIIAFICIFVPSLFSPAPSPKPRPQVQNTTTSTPSTKSPSKNISPPVPNPVPSKKSSNTAPTYRLTPSTAPNSSSSSYSVPYKASSPSTSAPTKTIPVAAGYVGNIRTGKFHVRGCRAERRMNESNRVYFNSRDEAINKGYVQCRICYP